MSDLRFSSFPSELRELRQSAATPPLSASGQAALRHARRGWHVFPVREKPGKPYWKDGKLTTPEVKSPYTDNGFRDGTTDERQIIEWWQKWPNALIGNWLGPSHLAVLDIDPRNGGDRHNLDGIISAKDTDTPAEWTLSGGEHFWYHCPDSAQLATTTLGPGLDLLAGDHYCIVSPSAGYAWMPGYGIDDIPLRPLPDGLHFAIPSKRRGTASTGAPATPDTQARFMAILGALGIAVTPDDGDVLVRCVFHDDLTPSLHVDARRAIYHCFAPSCAAHPGGGLRKLTALAKTQHGIILPSATMKIDLPWAVTDADRAACPDPNKRCAEVWHIAHGKGANVWGGLGHGSCHRADCPVWRKVRAGQLLRDVPAWAGIFAQTVTKATWRRLREAINRRNGRYLHVPQADGLILAITDALGDGWRAIGLAEVFEAVAATVGRGRDAARIGRQHADRKPSDGATASREQATASSFVGLDKSERLTVLALGNELVQPAEQKAILRALRLKGIGPAERDQVRELWRQAGFTVKGESFFGSWENARRLVALIQDWTVKRARRGRASKDATSVSCGVASLDADSAQRAAAGLSAGATPVISGGGDTVTTQKTDARR